MNMKKILLFAVLTLFALSKTNLLEAQDYLQVDLRCQTSIDTSTNSDTVILVFPKLKNDKTLKGPNGCRPLSLFALKDRIILSLTNKYLTRLFDNYFRDCSYAFRSKKNKENTKIVNHHDCIKDILEYRKKKSRQCFVDG